MSMPKTVILVGAGHAHVHVVFHAKALAAAGGRVVLVSPGDLWYSGMATGALGGQHPLDLDRLDVPAIAARHGVELVSERAVGLDRERRVVRVESGASLPYDLVSWNVGSEIDSSTVEGGGHAVGVKPIPAFLEMRGRLEARFVEDPAAVVRAVVVGGGAAGCEVAANLDALARRRGGRIDVTLVGRAERLLAEAPEGASRAIAQVFAERGITALTGTEVTRVERGGVVTSGGRSLPADEVVLATGLRAPRWLDGLDLPVGPRGGIAIDETLRSPADPRVFAAGDCAHFLPRPLPKIGVFGVRQSPFLLDGLRRALGGEPPVRWRPQRVWLWILNLGCGEALLLWGPLWWRGRLALRLKDHLDRSFMERHRVA
jgi:NADH dehydrogenase FAD-containing subunit